MRKTIFATVAIVLFASASFAAAQSHSRTDPAQPVRQFLDGFNTGDLKSAYAAYAPGDITIIDEFAPHHWAGPDAPHQWADGYDKHAKATGVTDGIVIYGAPTRVEVEGPDAYVILPTVYVYKEHGHGMKEEGQITAVLHTEANGWKIRAWTWSGVKPHPPN